MAGRRRKDPEGGDLVQQNMAVPQAVAVAFREGARAHGLTLVDYFSALVADERQRPDLGPALQEVMDFSATA